MKAIFVLAFVCLLNSAGATNYYFSSVSGNDSRTVYEAQDPSTPWKTLTKLNSFFSSLKPGDSVLLKRDETFYGSIVVKQSGSATSPIVIAANGSGKKPVITSLVTLNGFVSKGKGIWEASDSSLGSGVNMVLINEVEYGMGRYPNRGAANKGYLNFESHDGKTSITDPELTSSINWTGAELVLRPRHWILDRSLITSQSGNKISYSTKSPYEPFENYGYFIQNSIKTLDEFGEWYYDPSTKKMSVYFGSKKPSSYFLQTATMGDLVSSEKFSNVVFDNLEIRGANGSGFNITSGSNITIQDCDILFSGQDGVSVNWHKNVTIQHCTILNQNNNGIDINTGDNATIKNNRIVNSYLVTGMGRNGEGMGIGININSSNSLVEYNEIRNTGFQGIFFNGSDVTIKNNVIDSFCITKDDGGGIYSTRGTVPFFRRKVIGNIILNGIGTGKGTNDSNKVAAHGIYLDNNAAETDFRDNTIANCSNNGFNIHNSFGMTMENNTVYNNKIQVNMVQNADNVPVRNCVLTDNILFSKLPNQWISCIVSSADDIHSFGKFDGNYFARPLDDGITINTNYVGVNGSVTQNFDLDGWKQAFGQDKHSKKTAKQITPFRIDSLRGDNKFINGDFADNVKGVEVSGNSCVFTHGNSGLLDGGYLEVTPTSRGASFFFKVGSVTAGKNYILRYSLRGSDGNMTIGAGLRQSGFPYAALAQVQSRKINKSRTENEMLFSPSETQAAASVVFKVDNQRKFYIDNIKFYEADAKITNPDDSIRFEYNTTSLNKSVNLKGNYIDTRGNTYSKNITLAPYTSVVLTHMNGALKNVSPTVSIVIPANNSVVEPFSTITVNALAADVDGSITKVEFYKDSTLLRTDYTPAYSCILDSVAPGNYKITVKATDNNGLTTTSAPVVFSVPALNVAPVVSVAASTITPGFTAPASIEITAAATDKDGSVTKVEFYNGSTLLATENKFPYSYTWQNVAAGNYTITAKATDNYGLTATSPGVLISVKAPLASRSSSSLAAGGSAGAVGPPPAGNGLESMQGKGKVFPPENAKSLKPAGLSKMANFRLLPNPVVNMIQVCFDELQVQRKVELTMRNLAGTVLKKYPVIVSGNKIMVDVSSFIAGVYIIQLSGENFTINKKFLKVN